MSIFYELDLDRRKFLNECEYVIQVPGTAYLEETILKWRQAVICIPLFSYIGIKENNGYFELEERYINIFSKNGQSDDLNYFIEKIDEGAQNGIMNPLTWRDISNVHNLNMSKNTFERFKQCKIKIWSEIPLYSWIRSSVFSFFGLILYCFENSLPFERLNQYKETYKELLRRKDLKLDILNIQNKKFKDLTKEEKKSCNILPRLFEYLIAFQTAFTTLIQCHPLYSFLGPVFLDNKSREYNVPEAMIFDLPISTTRQEFSPVLWDMKKDKYTSYVNGLITDNKIGDGLLENPLEYSEIIIACWKENDKLFGPILSNLFSDHIPKFDIATKPQNEINYNDISNAIEMPIKTFYNSPNLIMIGPKENVNKAAKEIIESKNGFVHFNSATQIDCDNYGARFLQNDEFKLLKSKINISDSIKTEDNVVNAEDQNEVVEHYAKVWTNETGSEAKNIDKKRFEEFEKMKSDYDIFIIDNGEYERDAVGSIYFTGNEIRDFNSLKYRILFYTLKKNCFPREAINIIENCWFGIDGVLKHLKTLLIEKDDQGTKQQFHTDTNFLRAEISRLNQILKKNFGIRLITKGTGLFRLDPEIPKYCVIKINNSTQSN